MKLLEKLSAVAKQRGMAPSTIECYSLWIKQFLKFSKAAHGEWKHPSELGTADVEAFLNDLVVTRRLAGSTQNQALNALVFLYKRVLDTIPQDHLGKFLLQRSKLPKRVPTVLSQAEVKQVIEKVPVKHMSRLGKSKGTRFVCHFGKTNRVAVGFPVISPSIMPLGIFRLFPPVLATWGLGVQFNPDPLGLPNLHAGVKEQSVIRAQRLYFPRCAAPASRSSRSSRWHFCRCF
ncbi:MAG TPA: site-specific integrase [Tepidisphaeraceae bacterium]|jgi:hypothetical protein|nr:site-specific integrase [Tepidisphaeraceae bacterium]